MTWTSQPHRCARVVVPLLLLLVGAGWLTGCNDPLEVSDPTAILDRDLNNAEGAQLLRRAALRTLYDAIHQGAWWSGLLADEFLTERSLGSLQANFPNSQDLIDRRETAEHPRQLPRTVVASYGLLQDLRLRPVPAALAKLRAYAPPGAREAHVGEMFAVGGFAAMRLAEDICPGFPLHEVVDYELVYGPPLSTEQAFERALADFDSALTLAADSARILNFARVGRARALLGLGSFAEAASAAGAVPTGYVYLAEYSATVFQFNSLAIDRAGWATAGFFTDRRSVANAEGGNGLDFVSANDPRVTTIRLATARDGVTGLYGIGRYPTAGTPIVIASGLEARLIEAEAALRAGDPTWLTILNELRATQISPALPPLVDPGTAGARVDLLFRERAFWLFATGHRLGDLRRLISHYGRSNEDVFPRGAYWSGGVYAAGTSLPIPTQEATYSPGVTGCTSL